MAKDRLPKAPTNRQLAEQIEALKESTKNNATQDDLAQLAAHLFTVDADTKQLIPKFATAAQVAPVVEWHENLVQAAKFTSTGGKWLSRTVLALAAFFLAWGVLMGGLKGFLAWVAGWALTK